MESQWRARIPADIDRPEPILCALTGRQLAILAPVAAVMWGGFWTLRDVVDLWVLAAMGIPIAAVALTLVLAQKDGRGLDQIAASAVVWRITRKRQVAAPDGEVGAPPRWSPRTTTRNPGLSPLRLPASKVDAQGVLDLGDRRAALVVCGTRNLRLSSGREHDALVGAFASFLDGLTHPVQILVRRDRVDLTPTWRS